MATQAFKREELTLQDDDETVVTIAPLPIGRLRRFMAAWESLKDQPEDSDGFDVFINCCGVALENNFKDKFESTRYSGTKKTEFLSPDYKEYLTDVLDIETIYVIMEVAGGIKLNDPKLQEAALRAAEANL